MKVLEALPQSWGVRYLFHCPGCNGGHVFEVRTDGGSPSWSFNGDLERPTFGPSLLIRMPGWAFTKEWLSVPRRGTVHPQIPLVEVGPECLPTYQAVAERWGISPDPEAVLGEIERRRASAPMVTVCHLFLTNGKLQFLADCQHALAGQTVEMESVE